MAGESIWRDHSEAQRRRTSDITHGHQVTPNHQITLNCIIPPCTKHTSHHTFGQVRPQFEQRMNFTCPRACLLRPWLRRFLVCEEQCDVCVLMVWLWCSNVEKGMRGGMEILDWHDGWSVSNEKLILLSRESQRGSRDSTKWGISWTHVTMWHYIDDNYSIDTDHGGLDIQWGMFEGRELKLMMCGVGGEGNMEIRMMSQMRIMVCHIDMDALDSGLTTSWAPEELESTASQHHITHTNTINEKARVLLLLRLCLSALFCQCQRSIGRKGGERKKKRKKGRRKDTTWVCLFCCKIYVNCRNEVGVSFKHACRWRSTRGEREREREKVWCEREGDERCW